MKPARGGPVVESTEVVVRLPAALRRRLERAIPNVRLDAVCVAALGELADRMEAEARPGKLPIGRRP